MNPLVEVARVPVRFLRVLDDIADIAAATKDVPRLVSAAEELRDDLVPLVGELRALIEGLDRDARSLAQREQDLAEEAEGLRNHLATIEGQLSDVVGEGRPIARVAERVEGLAARLPGTRASRSGRSGGRPV